jgi:DNA invertase Pin-like site-specific DNA recombinase
MVNTILIEVYTTLAQQERETLLQRQSEAIAIAIAKSKDKHLGRPVLELPKGWSKYYKQWKSGGIKTAVQFMSLVSMKKSTFYKKLKEYEKSL